MISNLRFLATALVIFTNISSALFSQQVSNFGEEWGASYVTPTDRWWAKSFTTGAGEYQLDQIVIRGFSGVSNTTNVTAMLTSDIAGSPGTLVQNLSLQGQWGSGGPNFTLGSFASSEPVSLAPNTTYWLKVRGPEPFSWAIANPTFGTSFTGTDGWSLGAGKFSMNDSSWTYDSYASYNYIAVYATAAVPEPSTYAAIVGGSVLIAAFIFRRRHKSRETGR
jgi:hypothetical protein